MIALILLLIALLIYIILEILQRKTNIHKIQEKSKELLEKLKKNPQDENVLKELLEIQRGMYGYFMVSSLLILGVILAIKYLFPNEPVIYLPFNLPILNRNWIGPLGSYILFYFIVSTIANISKKVYKNFLRKLPHGKKNNNS